MFKASGTSPFFYHVPHDHNFSFLTVGYLGPGYWSEYYEYDYGEVVGMPGEKVDLQVHREVAARSRQGDALPRPQGRPQPAAGRRHVGLDQHHARLAVPALPQPVPVRREEVRDRRHPHQDLDRGPARPRRQSWRRQRPRPGRELRGRATPATASSFAALRELAAAAPDVDGGLEMLARGRASRRRLRRGDERARKRAHRRRTGAGSSVKQGAAANGVRRSDEAPLSS